MALVLVDHPCGGVWPVLAAVLPSGIGLISFFGDRLSIRLRAIIVFLLLLAVGGVQVYGQARNNRERIETRMERLRAERRASLERLKTESRIIETQDKFIELYIEIQKAIKDLASQREVNKNKENET